MAKRGTDVDLRIKRTQKAIKSAFFELLDEKSFEHISVKDITDRSLISRNTFYLHYADKYELLNKVCDELIIKLFFRISKQLRRVQREEFTVESIAGILRLGLMVVEENHEAYRILLCSSGIDMLSQKLNAMSRRFMDFIKDDIEGISEISIEYIVSGITGVIKYYVNNGVDNLDEECYNFTKIHLSSIVEIARETRSKKE